MHRRRILAGLGALPLLAGAARATPREATPATLARTIEEMPGGGEIRLAGGEYGNLRLEGTWPASSPLVLRSRDPADPARLRELMIINSGHIRLEQIVFDYRFRAGDERYHRPFQIGNSADIAVRASVFVGDLAGPGADVAEGFATGFGLSIRGARRILVEGNEFRRFGRGIICDDVDGLVIRGNDLHAMRSDGLNCVAVRNTVIEGNHFHDFERDLDSGDHPDMIQFWTARAVAPTRNVVIRRNLLNAGQGGWTQSIFMRNEEVDTGRAGEEMFYRDIEITDNVILNAHLHGITVGETRGLTIASNTVVRNSHAQGEADNPALWTPQIRIAPASRQVTVSRNVTSRVVGFEGQPDWRVDRNLLVQDRFRMEPGFYGTVFVREVMSNPTHPAAFLPLPGGPLDGTGLGATWLEPGVNGPPDRFGTPAGE